jgi:putative acetyltransferase
MKSARRRHFLSKGRFLSRLGVKVRPENDTDCCGITMVHDSAFKETNEGRFVWLLRQSKRFTRNLSLVAEAEPGKVVGHILFYPILIEGNNVHCSSLELAPLAVLPDYQKKGVGSELVREGLETARELGHESVIVYGDPSYYRRFGFKPARAWNIKAPFGAPRDRFMAIELKEGALATSGATVSYPREFEGG